MATATLVFLTWLLITTTFHFSSSKEMATYIIHMDLSAMPMAFASHHHWYAAALSTATTQEASTLPELFYAYDHVISGFSALLSPPHLDAISKSHGFLSAYPDKPVKLETTRTVDFLNLNPVSGIWPESSYGKDVLIGVIDTGVWPESASFKDDGMTEVPKRWKGRCEGGAAFNSSLCNRKLIGARYFNKGFKASNPRFGNSKDSARDWNGHGTHCASTAAGNFVEDASFFGYANGTAKGTAPAARVAVYKVYFEGGGWSSDVLAGIDQAIADGVDVLSVSMSTRPTPLYEDPFALGSFRAMEKNILPVFAAANDGPFPRSIHNAAPWQFNIGATTIDRKFTGIIILGNGTKLIGESLFPGNSSLVNIPLVYNDTLKACDSDELLKGVGHKIIVCETKERFELSSQYFYVSRSGVAGVIYVAGSTELSKNEAFHFPAIVVTTEDSAAIVEYAKRSSDPRVSLNFRQTFVGTQPAPYIASYSSRGPSEICPSVLKPDVVAPGSLVLAAWPSNRSAAEVGIHSLHSNFNILSGTSMACPHAAGVAALLRGKHPEWSPAAIQSAIMTTAYVTDNKLNRIRDLGNKLKSATPLDMGSGHIDPNKALDPGLIYDAGLADYEKFLCTLNYTKMQYQMITRSSSYPCSNSSSSFELNYPSFISYFDPHVPSKTSQEFPRTVTNVGDGSSIYKAKLTRMKGFNVSVIPDKLVFHEKFEKLKFTLTVRQRREMKEPVVHGYLRWIDSGAKHVVRSPIVAVRDFPFPPMTSGQTVG